MEATAAQAISTPKNKSGSDEVDPKKSLRRAKRRAGIGTARASPVRANTVTTVLSITVRSSRDSRLGLLCVARSMSSFVHPKVVERV